jgi:hypothetical protein
MARNSLNISVKGKAIGTVSNLKELFFENASVTENDYFFFTFEF